MSTQPGRGGELDVDEAVRALLLLMPQLIGRAKRTPPPAELAGLALGPRHLSLLSYLLFDGPMTVNELAARLEVAPTTVSLMTADLGRGGVVERREDPDDRRRRIVSITDAGRPAIEGWLGPGAAAWREALGPLTSAERQLVVDTLRAYERAASERSSPAS
ncbi:MULTISPECIES: MarR family winged helix-turn-helix transcriptional regulator [Pseudofrankia]|uniref:MarR family winged helix-turn-helix transcriptional regulator n=1 Tax=Pseudofrankia TaxID=2994363 RepID=UPI000234CA1E|nr:MULTISPECIES: MarR family winged helix-turn-helix transcriptional regulator [Pseudofrankia]OHV33412.1 MarR family transcriptional regulator [Pseudofrankia sp. EUN1h]